MIHYLHAENAGTAFTNGGLLQWQLMYYSGEGLICRFLDTRDRYPPYVAAVNRAYRSGATTALITYNKGPVENYQYRSFGDKYYVVLNPDRQLLDNLGFQMQPVNVR